ncbi:12922_t:CDS:1 [Entrophospora sp. SA101]|nr:15417_t:CDS:1 [Entrophospora sp. SA101]CAJ0747018.1 12922_t:CDS:1 [Entrophospora sp. SA101]CAJ0894451.1 13378_t:CDS:1 [Entrophospora sp. SA101]
MVKLPHKPTNLREYKCDLVINSQHFTKLEISPYYEKHNQEYLDALKRKSAKLSAKELAKKLITDDLIRKVLVPQLDGKKEIRIDGYYYQYTYYYYVPLYNGNKAYKLIWCCDENNLHILGVMDCFRVEKFDKDD